MRRSISKSSYTGGGNVGMETTAGEMDLESMKDAVPGGPKWKLWKARDGTVGSWKVRRGANLNVGVRDDCMLPESIHTLTHTGDIGSQRKEAPSTPHNLGYFIAITHTTVRKPTSQKHLSKLKDKKSSNSSTSLPHPSGSETKTQNDPLPSQQQRPSKAQHPAHQKPQPLTPSSSTQPDKQPASSKTPP